MQIRRNDRNLQIHNQSRYNIDKLYAYEIDIKKFSLYYDIYIRYDIYFRNYIVVTEGKIQIRLTPPKNNKYLDVEKDYEILEYKSKLDIWNIQKIWNIWLHIWTHCKD